MTNGVAVSDSLRSHRMYRRGTFSMALMRTSNPALGGDAFRATGAGYGEPMTISGAVNKTGILLMRSRYIHLELEPLPGFSSDRPSSVGDWRHRRLHRGSGHHLQEGVVAHDRSPVRPARRPCHGQRLGHDEMRLHGIVIQAVGLTFGVLFALLLAYRSGLIRATENSDWE